MCDCGLKQAFCTGQHLQRIEQATGWFKSPSRSPWCVQSLKLCLHTILTMLVKLACIALPTFSWQPGKHVKS